MESVDGIAELRMSGARAVFLAEEGASPAKADVAAAFEAKGMKLESLSEVRRPRTRALYLVDAGIT